MKICLVCENAIGRNSSKYCSNKCQATYQYEAYVERWLAGREDGKAALGLVSNHIRRYLKEKYGNRCQRCSWAEINPTTGNVPLEVEHIDGNHRNNNIDNLKLLCPNCHSLTPTYKALNKGNGRTRNN